MEEGLVWFVSGCTTTTGTFSCRKRRFLLALHPPYAAGPFPQGLAHIHEAGLFHEDLNPTTIQCCRVSADSGAAVSAALSRTAVAVSSKAFAPHLQLFLEQLVASAPLGRIRCKIAVHHLALISEGPTALRVDVPLPPPLSQPLSQPLSPPPRLLSQPAQSQAFASSPMPRAAMQCRDGPWVAAPASGSVLGPMLEDSRGQILVPSSDVSCCDASRLRPDGKAGSGPPRPYGGGAARSVASQERGPMLGAAAAQGDVSRQFSRELSANTAHWGAVTYVAPELLAGGDPALVSGGSDGGLRPAPEAILHPPPLASAAIEPAGSSPPTASATAAARPSSLSSPSRRGSGGGGGGGGGGPSPAFDAASTTAGPAANTFAFGMILWQLLVGRIPHYELHPAQILVARATGDGIDQGLPWPQDAGEELRRCGVACLQKEPARRPTLRAVAAVVEKEMALETARCLEVLTLHGRSSGLGGGGGGGGGSGGKP